MLTILGWDCCIKLRMWGYLQETKLLSANEKKRKLQQIPSMNARAVKLRYISIGESLRRGMRTLVGGVFFEKEIPLIWRKEPLGSKILVSQIHLKTQKLTVRMLLPMVEAKERASRTMKRKTIWILTCRSTAVRLIGVALGMVKH